MNTIHTKFKNPDINYREGYFNTETLPYSISPTESNYHELVITNKDNHSKCIYIDNNTGKRCKLKLKNYPKYCYLHTMLVENIYISKSNIEKAGKGLFAGPYGFKKGQIIGKYSTPNNSINLGNVKKNCENKENCWAYIFCEDNENDNAMCWDSLGIRSSIIRYINDAYNTHFKNNCYFDIIDNEVYVIASKKIKKNEEIMVSYGYKYW